MNSLRFVTFREADGRLASGVADDERVVKLADLGGDRWRDVDLKDIVARGEREVTEALEAGDRALADGSAQAIDVTRIALAPPIPNPGKIICLGLNYLEHIAEEGLEVPTNPTIFAKWPTSLIGPYDTISVPSDIADADYEGELAVVIGKSGRHIDAGDAGSYIAGYMSFNDVTARGLQDASSQWTVSKSVDTFAPCGPGLAPRVVIGSRHRAVRTWLNGELVQEGDTGDCVLDEARAIEYVSRWITVEPGDLLVTGTPAGVGASREPPRFLRPGDVVEVEVEGVGRLENAVIAGD